MAISKPWRKQLDSENEKIKLSGEVMNLAFEGKNSCVQWGVTGKESSCVQERGSWMEAEAKVAITGKSI